MAHKIIQTRAGDHRLDMADAGEQMILPVFHPTPTTHRPEAGPDTPLSGLFNQLNLRQFQG